MESLKKRVKELQNITIAILLKINKLIKLSNLYKPPTKKTLFTSKINQNSLT